MIYARFFAYDEYFAYFYANFIGFSVFEPDIRCIRREIGQILQGFPTHVGIARESQGVSMRTRATIS